MCIREIKAQKERLRRLQKQSDEAEQIAARVIDDNYYKRPQVKKRMRELEEEVEYLPTRDIAAVLLQKAQQVHEVAIKSGNLKGNLVKILKDSAMYIRVDSVCV